MSLMNSHTDLTKSDKLEPFIKTIFPRDSKNRIKVANINIKMCVLYKVCVYNKYTYGHIHLH